jgi:hypothetical protein
MILLSYKFLSGVGTAAGADATAGAAGAAGAAGGAAAGVETGAVSIAHKIK